MIAQLLGLGLLASLSVAQKLIPVNVGRTGDALSLRFSPEEVFADVGDLIQFQFYPVVSLGFFVVVVVVFGGGSFFY